MCPSIPLALAVIAIVYVAGGAVFFRQRQKINSGIDDLILNESTRTIELPLTFGRKQRVTVNVAEIKSLSVEKIIHQSNKGGVSYTYAPTLSLRGAEAAIQKLADWLDKLKADEFAEWLRKQLDPNISATLEFEPTPGPDEFGKTEAGKVAIEEFSRTGKSKVNISDGPNGREFYFPAARNLGMAIITTIVFLAFAGGLYAMIVHHFDVFFEMMFGLFAVILGCIAFSAWFKSSRVTIDSTGVRVIKCWLLFSRARNFAANDIVRFDTKAGMQSGSKVFQDVTLITKNLEDSFAAARERFQQTGQRPPLKFNISSPGGFTLASGIASKREADWLVAEMTKALGRKS